MKDLTLKPRQPTPERLEKAKKQMKETFAYKRYLKSVRYCQRCGKAFYPDKNGKYDLEEITDEKRGMKLMVCSDCKLSY